METFILLLLLLSSVIALATVPQAFIIILILIIIYLCDYLCDFSVLSIFLSIFKKSKTAKTPLSKNPSVKEIRTVQFNETLNLLHNTTNCHTFLGRMDFAYEISRETRSSDWLIYLDVNADSMTRNFIIRSTAREHAAINALKTPKGRTERFIRYRETMLSAFGNCPAVYAKDNIGFLNDKLDEINPDKRI